MFILPALLLRHLLAATLCLATLAAAAQESTRTGPRPKTTRTAAPEAAAYAPSVPAPTLAGVRYGDHERHVLDVWKAESSAPTPLVFVVHGGSWMGGSKERVNRFVDVAALLDAGISVAAINYRLITRDAPDTQPPVKAPLHDAARALQFVRSKAGEWNIDPTRIGAAGGSAEVVYSGAPDVRHPTPTEFLIATLRPDRR